MKGNMGVARRIISMLLVMSILINILPNFGVLTNKVEAATSNPHIILEIDKEYGLATNVAGGTIFALNLYIEDLNATAFEIPILYDNNKIKPGQVMVMGTMIAGSEATTVANFTSNMATDTQYSSADGEKMRVDTSETEKTLMGTGFVDLYFNRESYNNFDITDKTLITKFYFLIPAGSSITTIEQIDSSIISLDSTKFRIYNFEADEGQQEDFSASNYSMKYAAEEQVSATITSIAVSNDPKNVYTTKENFTSEGMVVTATYSDDSTKELTSEEYTVSEVNLSTAGVKEITITYKEDESITTTTNVLAYPAEFTAEYGQTLEDITLPTGFEWENPTTLVGSVGDNTHTLKYTGTDFEGTKTGLVATVEVGKADPEYELPTGLTATYGDKLSSVTLPEGFSWEAEEGTLVGNAGTQKHTVTYTPSDTANYNTVEDIEVSIEVAKADPEYEVPTGLEAGYGDTLADVTLPEGFSWQDGETTSVGNVGDNTFKVTYTPSDTANYNTVEDIDVVVKVGKATPEYEVPTGLIATYGDTLADVTLPEGFSWQDGETTSVGNAGTQKHTVKYTPADTNYREVTGIEVSVEVRKADPEYEVPTGLTATYGDKLADVTLPEGFSWEAEEGTLVGNAGTQKHTVTYTPSDIANYNTVEDIEVSVEVAKADPECSVEDIIITYGDTLADKLPTGYTWGTEVDTTKQYKVVEGGYNFTATYTPADTDNYNVVSDIPVKVIVKKATPNVTVPTGLEGYEGQPLSSVTLPSYAEGTFTWKDATKILEGTTDEAIAIYIPTDENYTTVEVPVSVTVIRNTVQSIEITKLPNNEYFEGAMFNPDGMEVIATYGYGAPQPVENYTYEIVDENGNVLTEPLTTNAKKVRVTYEGKTAEKEITVKEDYVTSISVAAPNKDYTYGDTIDLTNVTISKVWASGLSHGADDKEAVILDMISCTGIDENGKITNTGTLTVTVTYTNEKGDKLTDTFDIVVEDTIVNITMSDIETSYFVGDEIDPTLAITVDYGVKADETIPVQASWIKGIDMSKPGTYTLTIAYGDDDSLYPTKQITVKDFASKIEVNKETVIYKIGATVDFAKDVLVNKYMASDTSKAQTLTSGYTMSPATVDTTVATTAPITVTVSYVNEKGITLTDSFTVQVINATSGASIEKLPEMPTKLGDELVLDGGMVKVTKQDGSSIEIPMTDPSIKIAPAYNKNTQNKQELSLTYTYTELDENGNQVSNTIPVEGKLVIELKDWWTGKIVAQGIPTTSILGEDLDLTNATVSKVMYSGEHAETTPVTGAMISGFDKNVEGPQTVVVTYYGKETSVVVNVTDKTTGISMNTNPDKTEYTQGENIDVTGATLNVTKASGIKVIPITKEMISGYDPSKKGQQVVTVTYEGFTAEFIVNVKPGENKPVTPEKPGTSKPTNPTKPNTEEIATYTVTFVNYDGTVIKTEKVAKGKSATAPEMEERVGYKFLGWSKEFDNVEEDLTVMAEYEEIVRAKVNAPDNIVIEKGEELDPEGITIEIFDEDGEKTDEVPVTIDMISGFDPEKVGTQEVTVTYVDEDGYEYTATFKVKVVRPVETLGVKDEVQEDEGNSLVLPIVAGTGISAVLLFLIAWMTRKNVEIYALTENERKLIGKQKISKNDTRIVLDEYENELENANIEIVLNKKITSKLDQEMVDVVFKGKKATYKVVSEDNKEFSIKMKNN